MDVCIFLVSGMGHIILMIIVSCSLDLFLRFLVQQYHAQLVPYVCLEACRVMSKGQKIYYYYLRESVRRDGARTRQTGDNDKSRTGGNTVIIIIIVINGRWLMAVHDGCFNIGIIAGCCSRFIVARNHRIRSLVNYIMQVPAWYKYLLPIMRIRNVPEY